MSEPVPERVLPVVAGGVAWKLGMQLIAYGGRAIVTIVLAHLLTPRDFGVAGLALLFTSLVLVFADMGAALIHRQDLREADRSTAFWLSLGTGILLATLGVVCAEPLAEFFGEPQVKPLLMVLSIGFILTGATTTPNALLHRALAFRRIEIANLVAVLTAAGVAVLVAFGGGGAWSIIVQQIVGSGIYLVLIWSISGWRPRLLFSSESARGLGGYSLNLIGAKFFDYTQTNSDNLLIGRFLGATSLGVYSLSYNLMLYPVIRLSDPINSAMFPVLARMQDDNVRIAGIWLRITRFVAALVAPAMLLLIVLAPEFVQIVLGSKWDAAVPVIQILSWAGLVQAVRGPTSPVLLTKGRTPQLLRFAVISATMLVAAFAVSLRWGVIGVAVSYSATFTLLMPFYVRIGARAVGLGMRRYWANLTGVALAAVCLVAAAVSLRLALVSMNVGAWLVMLIVIVGAACVYVPVCLWRAPGLLGDLRMLRDLVRKRSKGAMQPKATAVPGSLAQ